MSDEGIEKAFGELVRVIARLRDPQGGCPWDLEQTHASLKPYIIEEAHELIDAIDEGPDKIKEELGDVLLQVVLHSQVARDNGSFDIADVVRGITEKMIARHPHVFGETKVSGSAQVLQNWEQIKNAQSKRESVLDGVPRSLPGLLRAHKLGEKVAKVGFDWENLEGVGLKILEEQGELLEQLRHEEQDRTKQREELGDLLFSLAQLARMLGFDAEEALREGNDKFARRFKHLEKTAGAELKSLSREQLTELWREVKQAE